MADPVPDRPRLGGIVDHIADAEKRLQRLERPGAGQRAQTAGTLEATVAYLASLKTFVSSGSNVATLTNVAADGVTRWFWLGPSATPTTPPNSHFLADLEVPTNRMMVTASVGEASITPHDGFMIAYVSFRVFDSQGVSVMTLGQRSGRLYTNLRMGQTISTGPVAVNIDRNKSIGPYTVVLYVGYWAQNTGPDKTVTLVFNTPSLRVDIIDAG